MLTGLPEPRKPFIIESRNWGVKKIGNAQRVRDNYRISAARALGFSPGQYRTSAHFFATMKTYSDLKLAGLPVKGPEVDSAIEEINHVSEVLTDAAAAYERLHAPPMKC